MRFEIKIQHAEMRQIISAHLFAYFKRSGLEILSLRQDEHGDTVVIAVSTGQPADMLIDALNQSPQDLEVEK